MFDALHFESNKSLIKEAAKLVSDHNELSHKKLVFDPPIVEFKFISSASRYQSSKICTTIINFYEEYASQSYSAFILKPIVEATVYNHDDLAIQIDLSSDAIISLMSKLSITHEKLFDIRERIAANLLTQVNAFIADIAETILDKDVDLVIDLVFDCMAQKGLGSKLNIDESVRPFIVAGSKVIEAMFNKGVLTPAQQQVIKTKNDEFKRFILEESKLTPTPTMNKLQTFGLVPREGKNKSLNEIIPELFGLSIPNVNSLEDATKDIHKILQLLTTDTGLSTGIIVIISRNTDVYFDMTSLFQVSKPWGAKGVNEEMINTFDLIKIGGDSTSKQTQTISINVNEHTQLAYLLWTNDFRTFKYKSSPIDNLLIQKILRKSPSRTIESYNAMFESMIAAQETNDAFEFNKVKYMSFTKDGSEDEFLNELQKSLVAYILKQKNPKEMTSEFSDGMFAVLDDSKIKLGILSHQLSPHCHIIYGNMAAKIVGKLKKELYAQPQITPQIVKDIVKLVVCTNDNIYSRVIGGHYLHLGMN